MTVPALDGAALPLALNCHFHVAETAKQAADEFFPAYSLTMNRIGRERGRLAGPAEWNSPEAVAQISALIDERKQ